MKKITVSTLLEMKKKGEKIVADNVWRALEPVVREVYSTRAKG